MKNIIQTLHLMHEFLVKDDEGKIESSNRVLQDISIEIEAGSFVALLGHNGSGKSTLARHLNALLQPTDGTVWVDGYDTKNQDTVLSVRKAAGMVFQNPDNQIIASVVEEDVAFGPENTGVPTKEIWQRVADSLDCVGMTPYRYHSPNRLSGGQKQRIAIAGIMAMQPSCMILDEATAMLDPLGRKEVLAAIHDLNKKAGVTVILITHYMEEAIDADRVLVMDKGNVVMDGTPEDIFARVEELKALRLDVPQITELAWMLRQQGMPLPDGILKQDELINALDKILGESKMGEVTCPS
jgi:energy-coupling factor transport system ATP-binding protein